MTQGPLIRLVPQDELGVLVTAYLDDLALAKRSPKTILFYESNLGRYRWWLEREGIPTQPAQHTKGIVRDFLRYVQTAPQRWDTAGRHNMADRVAGDRTVHAYFRALRAFYNWLVVEEYIDRSPMLTIKPPRISGDQPEPFTTGELGRLAAALAAAGSGMLPDRNRAIVAILLDVGLRASELAAVQAEHYGITSGDLYVVAGKGNKPRHLRVGARARKVVRRYWLNHRWQFGQSGPLFLSRTNEAMTGDGIHDVTTRLGVRAGVDPSNPHRFRHTFAVTAIRAGMREFEVQMILGHTDLAMTRRYVKLAEEDSIRAGNEHSPLDHLKLTL